ncbi:MAG: SUMF1/EgtB/PvdO family nonheme iron enzyme, partial [Anaerolineae bacterium]
MAHSTAPKPTSGPHDLAAKGISETGETLRAIVGNLRGHPTFLFGTATMLLAFAAFVVLVLSLNKITDRTIAILLIVVVLVFMLFGLLMTVVEVRAARGRSSTFTSETQEQEQPFEPPVIAPPPEPAPREPDAPATLTDYLAWLAPRCNELRLRIIDPVYADKHGRSLVTLDDVYTDLNTTTRLPVEEGRAKTRPRGDRLEAMAGEETRILSALEAVSQRADRCVVLTGDPGSGKSTFLHRLAYCLARSRLAPLHADGWLERLTPWPFDFKVPIVVTLLNFAARGLPSHPQAEGKASHLTRFIRAELTRSELGGFAEALMAMLRDPAQGGLLLLDGLDEVPEPGRQRVQIRQAVEDFAAAFPHCRVIVTCRDYAYDDPRAPWILRHFQRHRLAEFDQAQIGSFIDRWIAASAPLENWDEETAKAKAGQFKAEVQPPRSAAQLAPRPILLQLMATLFAKGGSLPDDRAELYADSVKLLLDHWQKSKMVYRDDKPFVEGGILDTLGVRREQLEQALHNVAYQAHLRQAQSADRSMQQAADIRERDLKADLEAVLGRDSGPVVDYIQKRAGLLLGRGGDRYAFPHRTFQEYLAACHLTGLGDFHERVAGHMYQEAEWWREVFLLAALQSKKQAAVSLIDFLWPEDCDPALAAATAEHRWRVAALAAEAAVEVGLPDLAHRAEEEAHGSRFYPVVRDRLAGWQAALLETRGLPLSARERAISGRHLAFLGDPRPGVCQVQPLFVPVLAGEFLMGSPRTVVEQWINESGTEWHNDELPQHPVYLDTYYVARYPTTNAQYAAFVRAIGHEAPRHWQGGTPPTELLNHPVVYVSWHDAVAYCQWLTAQLRTAGRTWRTWRDGNIEPLNLEPSTLQNAEIRLPTEAEWEKAARGEADGREWPWGDEWDGEKCNWGGNAIDGTTPVGTYPAGASPCGALDMVGNVWEWCADWYGEKVYQERAGGEVSRNPTGPRSGRSRVLRGGAFDDNQRYVRCAARHFGNPHLRNWDFGLRVVLVFPGHSGI